MKSYTDLEQSKKLAEILPIESADMHYNNVSVRGVNYVDDYRAELMDYNTATKVLSKYSINPLFGVVPCWSLAALLGVLPVSCDDGQHCLALINSNPNGEVEWLCSYEDYMGNLMMECYADNQIDACFEMIIKLNEQKIL